MLKDLLSDKKKLLGLANTSLTENCSAVLLKKLPVKLGDPEKILIPCDFLELEKCMALADLAGIVEDVCVQVSKFTFPVDFVVVVVDYDIDPRVLLILGRPFLRTARALVDVYGEELILRDDDEKLIFHVDSTSKHPHKHGNESINMINFIDITCEDRFLEVLKIKKSNHPLSGSTTSLSDSSPSLTPIETTDLREIEYLFNRDPSTDSSPTTDIDIIDPILERFTDEPTLVYSSPPGDDDDDLFFTLSPIMKNGKSFCMLLDSDSTLPEESSESSEIATLLSSPFRNEDKVFNPGILILGGTQIFNDESHDKNLKEKTSFEALLILEKCNFLSISSDQELLFHLELSVTETLLSFSSKNEDKVFNPGIPISKGVHSFTLGLSHRTYETFKIANVHPNILNEDISPLNPRSRVVAGIIRLLTSGRSLLKQCSYNTFEEDSPSTYMRWMRCPSTSASITIGFSCPSLFARGGKEISSHAEKH
ncbi:reverse transcriptase domain-containing protein [Tanacetum coccineum]